MPPPSLNNQLRYRQDINWTQTVVVKVVSSGVKLGTGGNYI
jgi:hypothetical protein